MAIDFNGALTLADQAILSNDPLVKEITKSLHKTWNAVKDIPFYTSPSLRQIGMRYTNSGIPLPNWTGINSEPQAVKGKPKQYEEQMFLLRNKITIDKVLLDQPNNIIDPVDAQVQMFLEGFAYDFNDKFINNDPTNTAPGNSPDCFPGLRYRLSNPTQFDMASDMTIYSAADLTLATLLGGTSSAPASANRMIYDLQNLFDNMNSPDGDGIILYVSEQAKRVMETAIRVMGIGSGFDVTQDNYDRPVEMYKNAKIRVVGRKSDGLTSVIDNNQTQAALTGGVTWSDGSTAQKTGVTDIYAVRYGTGYVQGWQPKPFKPENLGRSQENGIMHNILFEWGCGLWIPHTRAIGRVRVKVN
jgi:hypothetical protein